ncbi:flagellar biosynthetic protein FliR [Paenibacillus sp. JX-17]|uniref:Flagellar biosynthetic protein FliR n=1 Tax=Paenibacillus lacisoli TaxID=3064525 RepID=A0ABT9CDZ3_9BACL|nr:flagellar biosynthetic protein FliR [Paenibacillus sp. JX-17]MDO7905818.1 flagellar biosynthetic protein FliR [Paenibacillus sp. JX-17]
MNIVLQNFPVFLLIFCRITSFFVVAPIFSTRGVPNIFKVGISAMLSIMITLIYGINQKVPTDVSYVLLVAREVLIGLLLGFVAYLIFTAIQTAGALIDFQVGFAMATVYDPMTGASVPVTGNFKFAIAILLFLTMNGHHYLLDAIVYSYDWVPLQNDFFTKLYGGSISSFLIRTFADSFMLAFQMSAPIVVAMFLTDVGLGFLAKTAPQFNIFVIGVPLKIIVGLAMLMLLFPSFAYIFERLFAIMFQSMQDLLGIIGHRR